MTPPATNSDSGLPDGLMIHYSHGRIAVTHPQTGSTFTLVGELKDDNVASQCAAHLARWQLDELQFAPAVEELRAKGFLPRPTELHPLAILETISREQRLHRERFIRE